VRRLNDEQRALAAAHRRLAFWRVRVREDARRRLRWCDRDELLGEALYGLVRAALSYDPAGGARFQTYAVRCIDRAIDRFVARQRTAKRGGKVAIASLDALLRLPKDERELTPAAASGSEWTAGRRGRALGVEPAARPDGGADAADAADLLRLLPPHYRRALRMLAESYEKKEIGAASGVSREAARQTVARALEMAARRLGA